MLTHTHYVRIVSILLTGLFAAASGNVAKAAEGLAQQAAALGLPSPVIRLVNNQQPQYLPVQEVVPGSASVVWFSGHHNARWLTHLNAESSVKAVAQIADCVFFLTDKNDSCAAANMMVAAHEEHGVWEWIETNNAWQCEETQSCTLSAQASGYQEWQSNPNFSLISMMQGRGEAHFIWRGHMNLNQLYQQALALGRQPGNQLMEHGQWPNVTMSVNFQRGNSLHQLKAKANKNQQVHLFWIVQTVGP